MLSNYLVHSETLNQGEQNSNIIIKTIDYPAKKQANASQRKIANNNNEFIPFTNAGNDNYQTRFAQLFQCKKLMLFTRSSMRKNKSFPLFDAFKLRKNKNRGVIHERKDYYYKLLKFLNQAQREMILQKPIQQTLMISKIEKNENNRTNIQSRLSRGQLNRQFASLTNIRNRAKTANPQTSRR